MSAPPLRVSPGWLQLREAADGAARSTDLVEELRPRVPSGGPLHIHDLGSGTGAMGRWLAPRLAGRQHWTLYDRDADLLTRATVDPPTATADGGSVTLETRRRDITRLDPAELAGSSLITASALLDMLTADELERFVATCVHAGCPTLVTLSVTGHVELTPADPFDEAVRDAFNDHQRRSTPRGRRLGPDAVDAAVDAFTRLGQGVEVRPSPWRLDGGRSELTAAWFEGWAAAAFEQRPELAEAGAGYARTRVADARAGRLSVTVHHQDVLAWPR